LPAEPTVTPLFGDDPGPVLERWTMPHVLIVSAGKFCNPIIVRVGVKADDFLLHS